MINYAVFKITTRIIFIVYALDVNSYLISISGIKVDGLNNLSIAEFRYRFLCG